MKNCIMGVAVFAAMSMSAVELNLERTCIIRARRENAQQKAAADDLSKHLELITGVKPHEGKLENSTAVFSFVRPAGEPKKRFTSFARREGDTIRFWGDDFVTRGKPQYGSAFAVAEFLERYLGVRWVTPGDDGIVFTRQKSCDVPADWKWERDYPFYVSMMRNIDTKWGKRMKYTVRRPFPYRHAFGKWPARFMKTHPEYFGLNPYGRRGVEGGKARVTKLCLSNNACIDQIIADWMSSGTNVFLNICPNDGTLGFCRCEKCLALDERRPGESFFANLTDRYLNFWNRVAARARTVRPDVKVVTYIYSYYRHAPRRERILHPDNMLFGIVPSGLDDYRADLDGWKKAGLKSGTFFIRPNFTAYKGKLPRGYERELHEIYHYYLKEGSFGFDYDGRYAPEMAFEYYVLMRQLDKPEYPFERIEDEYCSQYGNCSATAKAYFKRIRERGEKGRVELKIAMRKGGNDVLDDSMLGRFIVDSHSERELKDDLALLEGADASGLAPAERKRWESLVAEARGYLEAYAAAVERKSNPLKLKEEGWCTSFDLPSLQGWRMRDLEGGCTFEAASFDRYSVKFRTRAEKSIALWRKDVPVTPDAKYTLSFDARTPKGAGTVGFRVASGGKTIASRYFHGKSDIWRRHSMDFIVPSQTDSVALYFVVDEGVENLTVYLDHVVFQKVAVTDNRAEIDAGTFDLVVYGSSPAAISAAIQAKRMGKNAIIVSPESRIGGLTTGGLGQTDIGNKAAFGGIALEFYKAIASYYSSRSNWRWQNPASYFPDGQCAGTKDKGSMWTFEPSAALAVLEGWEKRDALDIRRGERLDRKSGVKKIGERIVSIRTLSGQVYRGKMFVDATYEGDLMAAAGVSYMVGREANSVYGETINGIQSNGLGSMHHNFHEGVSAYVIEGNPKSGLLSGIERFNPSERDGDGDRRVQAYCFRMCLTDVSENRIPFKKPEGYNERDYELLFREYAALEANPDVIVRGCLTGRNRIPFIMSRMPNGKTDSNNRTGFSSDFIGRNWAWPEASYEERDRIFKAHLDYQRGLMWTLANHPRIPSDIREFFSKWGTCRDEFLDGAGDGWQTQLYVREARRMIGETVMTEHHCRGVVVASRPVAMGAYTMDSHHVRRYATADGVVRNEGNIEVSRNKDGSRFPPYPIDYGAVIPRREECSNLFVPVCMSASHIAFGSIRMEPVFFALGQVAGTAAALAVECGVPVQDIPYGKLVERLQTDGQVLSLP